MYPPPPMMIAIAISFITVKKFCTFVAKATLYALINVIKTEINITENILIR